MTWLVSQMWIYLGAAALLALLFGFSLRGALLRGRLRRAEVERGVAQTELDQARKEIEGLYAAQRRLTGEGGDTAAADLAERDARVSALGEELAAAKAELETLKTSGPSPDLASGAVGAAIGAVAGAVSSQDHEVLQAERDGLQAELERVRAELSTAQAALAADPVAVVSATAAEGEQTELEKLRWQNDYLQTRVKSLEARFGPADAELAAAEPEPAPELVQAAAPAAVEDDDRETPDEELARLRWRNRYLEGRLAYLEEERSRDPEPAATGAAVIGAVAGEAAAAVAETVDAGEETVEEPVSEAPASEPIPVEETPVAELEPAVEPAAPAPAPVLVTEPAAPAPIAPVEPAPVSAPEKPLSLDKPRDGAPDDLTQIEGIGPRIADVLQSLGVYHFDQIAAWSPENVAWIDQYMSFDDRVGQEDWVGQAKGFNGTAA